MTGYMRVATTILAAAVIAAGCSGTDATGSSVGSDETATAGAGVEDDRPALMAAALHHLVTEDHTFGDGPPPFSQYLVLARLDPQAGAESDQPRDDRPLTAAERAAVEDEIRTLGPVRWIDDRDEWVTDDLEPTVDGAAILGVGEPTVDGDSALVPVSLWCGGLCGLWVTYQLDSDDGVWRVTGTEGPVTIS
jgi:hypothetical protein